MANKYTPEPVDEPVEALDGPVEAPKAPEPVTVPAGVIVVSNGDSWRSLAEAHAPKGAKVNDYAAALCELNGCAPLREGTRIQLPAGK
jgi:hypothetical protein